MTDKNLRNGIIIVAIFEAVAVIPILIYVIFYK